MAKQTINIGSVADDGTGDTIRAGGDKINDNFDELYDRFPVPANDAEVWLTGLGMQGANGSRNMVAGEVHYVPALILSSFTIDELLFRVSTTASGQNLQHAIYASNSDNLPTGAPLVTAGAVSIASGGNKSIALSADLALTPGVYWIAAAVDGGSGRLYASRADNIDLYTYTAGVPSFDIAQGDRGFEGLVSTGHTYGTWDDVTSETFEGLINTTSRTIYRGKVKV